MCIISNALFIFLTPFANNNLVCLAFFEQGHNICQKLNKGGILFIIELKNIFDIRFSSVDWFWFSFSASTRDDLNS